tara:strand:- start:7062 stop:8210 length:1149 start_codon:yes stop_codon:yes gene_type:complete
MKELNKIRDKQQRLALNAWARNKYCGSIIAGTGFGKSRVGVLAIEYILKDGGNALVLVPTVQLQDQFRKEFDKWGVDSTDVEIMCYQSAYKFIGNHYSIVICDEIHLGLSKEYRKFFYNNTYDSLLCMTATLPEDPEYKVKLHMFAPTVYEITLDECVALGIVAPYKINCVPLKLTEAEADEYKKVNNLFVYYKYKLGQFDAFKEAQRLVADKNAASEDRASAAQFYRCIRQRKKIVDFASNKIPEFKKLVLNNLDKKILAFSGANDFTDELCESIDPHGTAYHSKKTKKQKENALEAFNNGSKTVLCSTKALNQGFDVPNANMGIICGITSKGLSMIQRVGRLIRFQKGKIGNIYILYIQGTQEEKWLKNAVKNLDNINWL